MYKEWMVEKVLRHLKEKSKGSKIKMPDLDAAVKSEEIDSGRQEDGENVWNSSRNLRACGKRT